ncbi:MAG TPA: hypothetical protein PLD10_03550 [Rhodopila sp.]|nr:hypothetical protein [Rhodopila sp.]
MTFLELTIRLTETLRQETMLARSGALGQLRRAAVAKQGAFEAFREACAARDAQSPGSPEEQEALRNLLVAANESALVLEAVKGTLDEFVAKLKAAVSSLADSGTYGPSAWRSRHVQAVHLDASA